MAGGHYLHAIRTAVDSSQGVLRTLETIHRFQDVSSPVRPMDLIYFDRLLEKGKLNAVESFELVRQMLERSKQTFIVGWKITNSHAVKTLGTLCGIKIEISRVRCVDQSHQQQIRWLSECFFTTILYCLCPSLTREAPRFEGSVWLCNCASGCCKMFALGRTQFP